MEQKVNMDNFLNFVDAKSLKDENQRLKDEKLCKVLVNGSTATAKSVDVYLIFSCVPREQTTHYIGPLVGWLVGRLVPFLLFWPSPALLLPTRTQLG